jgi:hypothetical protein
MFVESVLASQDDVLASQDDVLASQDDVGILWHLQLFPLLCRVRIKPMSYTSQANV